MTRLVQARDAQDPGQVGGKAAALCRLAAAGYPPPDFFVVPARVFRGQDLPPEIEAEIRQELDHIGSGPYAVRSSAVAEDSAALSHAGQFASFLDIAAGDVTRAVARVRASAEAEPVSAYRSLHSATGDEPGLSVIVQRMVAARASGVAFSADPVSGRRDRVVVSAIEGLGERLVSGEADGESWTFDRQGRVITAPKSPQVLTKEEAGAVAELACGVEGAFAAAQDIEWAFEGDRLHILQARPITTPLKPRAVADDKVLIFDNSNIVESYPGLVSPLTYSFAVYVYARVYRAFVRLLGVPEARIASNAAVFDNMLGRIDGHVYYNLVNWYQALAMLPGFSLNREYMETMMGVSEPLPRKIAETIGPPPAKGWRRLFEAARIGVVAGKLVWQAVLLPRTRRRFYARLERALDGSFAIETASLSELAQKYRMVESQLLDRWDAPLINDFLCMIGFGASRNLMQHWLGDRGPQLHNDVMIGQGDIVSAEPAQRILRMAGMVAEADLAEALLSDGIAALDSHPKLRAELDDYLRKFGDRCVQELKLESVPLTDDPMPILRAIAAHAERPSAEAPTRPEADWLALFRGRPLRRWIARALLTWVKARVRDRENLRYERTRLFGYARRIFLAMGRELTAWDRLAAERDVFFLTIGELLAASEGGGLSADLKALVALRKAEDAASAKSMDPPERLELRPGAGTVDCRAAAPRDDCDSAERQGIGCSAGTVLAAARVISDPASQSLDAGEVLVARHTDPGWIAYFANASAIVVERGSLLSHSAIVARELGIPCVVAVKGAMDWIKDGEMIHVDGARGIVRKPHG